MTNDKWKCKCENNSGWLPTVDRCSLCGATRPERRAPMNDEEMAFAMRNAARTAMGLNELSEKAWKSSLYDHKADMARLAKARELLCPPKPTADRVEVVALAMLHEQHCRNQTGKRPSLSEISPQLADMWRDSARRVLQYIDAFEVKEAPKPEPSVDHAEALEGILWATHLADPGFRGMAVAALDFCRDLNATEVKALHAKLDDAIYTSDRDSRLIRDLANEMSRLGLSWQDSDNVTEAAAQFLAENKSQNETLNKKIKVLEANLILAREGDKFRAGEIDKLVERVGVLIKERDDAKAKVAPLNEENKGLIEFAGNRQALIDDLKEQVATLISERDSLKKRNDRDQDAICVLSEGLFDLGIKAKDGETVTVAAARSLRENIELVRILKDQLAKLQGPADLSPEVDRLRRVVTDMQMRAGQMASVAEGALKWEKRVPKAGDMVVILDSVCSCATNRRMLDTVRHVESGELNTEYHNERRIDKEGIEWRFATPEEVAAGNVLP